MNNEYCRVFFIFMPCFSVHRLFFTNQIPCFQLLKIAKIKRFTYFLLTPENRKNEYLQTLEAFLTEY